MRTWVPRAAAMPPIRAFPWPRAVTLTTRAPSFRAISGEPSVDPLSATITSPEIPPSLSARRAFSMQAASVSASLRHGMTMDSSIGPLSITPPPSSEQIDIGLRLRRHRIPGKDVLARRHAERRPPPGVFEEPLQGTIPFVPVVSHDESRLPVHDHLRPGAHVRDHRDDRQRRVLNGLEPDLATLPEPIRDRHEADVDRLEVLDLRFLPPRHVLVVRDLRIRRRDVADHAKHEVVPLLQPDECRDDDVQVGDGRSAPRPPDHRASVGRRRPSPPVILGVDGSGEQRDTRIELTRPINEKPVARRHLPAPPRDVGHLRAPTQRRRRPPCPPPPFFLKLPLHFLN